MSSNSPAGTFWAVLGALVVFGVIVLGYNAWQDNRRAERCEVQSFSDAIDRDNGGSGINIDADC